MDKLSQHIDEIFCNSEIESSVQKEVRKVLEDNRTKFFGLEIESVVESVCVLLGKEKDSLDSGSKIHLFDLIRAINWHDIHYINKEITNEIIEVVCY